MELYVEAFIASAFDGGGVVSCISQPLHFQVDLHSPPKST